jgi:hypothetical protein
MGKTESRQGCQTCCQTCPSKESYPYPSRKRSSQKAPFGFGQGPLGEAEETGEDHAVAPTVFTGQGEVGGYEEGDVYLT